MLSAFVLFAHAQKNLPKGSVLLGGDLSFGTNKIKDPYNNVERKSTGFLISPSVALAVKDNLFVGLSLGYNYYKTTSQTPASSYDSLTQRGYSASIFVRKYKPLKNNFYLFLQGGVGGTYSDRSIENVPNRDFSQKDVNINLSLSPGISYAINSKLQIETGLNGIFGIGYTNSNFTDNSSFQGKRTSTSFNAYTSLNNFSSQLYFGFRLLLQKKTKA